jgi:hypothetical protein
MAIKTVSCDGFQIRHNKNAMFCPICNNLPVRVYQCDCCGEVRCGHEQCTGSAGNDYHRWASNGTSCRHCSTGHYEMIGFNSDEMASFLKEYTAIQSDKQDILINQSEYLI